MLTALTKARDAAQSASAEADIALIEATASADALREEARKLSAAVAALSGEPSALIEPQGTKKPSTSPEEFDKVRKARQKAKEAEENANNPYSNLKCTGCGRKGRISEVFTENGTRMLECRCGNQML